MKKNWLLLSGLVSLFGTLSASDRASSLQEGLELRRIAEYCKEKNYNAVKAQIHTFLNKHPHSDSGDALYAMLGDILFSENDFLSALTAYNLIKKEDLQLKTGFRRIHCLHQLARFQEVISETQSFLKNDTVCTHELPTLRVQLANALFRQSLSSDDHETKTKLLHLAKEQFKLLTNTEYADQALVPLAHIYTFLKEYPQAVKTYLSLTEKDAKNKEEYFLQILQLQVRFDRPAAIETCQKIYDLNGPAASQAAFNQLSLLFQEKRYRDIAHFQDKPLKYISQEHLPIAHYYIGRSLYHIGDHVHAAVNLEKYLSFKNDENAHRIKNALFTVLHCAKEMDDFDRFEKTLAEIRNAFPDDSETKKAILLHSQLCKHKGKVPQAILNLKELLETFSDLSQRDNILYDYGLLHEREHHWPDAACAFETFIKQFPSHQLYKAAWRHLIHCRFNAIKESSPETIFVNKEELITTLNHALKEQVVFSAEERKKLRFSYAKTLFENQKYQRALGELVEYVKDYHNDANISEAFLLLALSYYHGTQDLDLFTAYAEKALSIHPNMPEALKLHLNLFNTYLTRVEKKNDDSEKNDMLLKAADHLFQALDQPIKKENQLWLANFYFHQFKEDSSQSSFFLDRSIAVLERILSFTPSSNQQMGLSIPEDKLEMEGEAIKLAELYAAKKKNQERIHLLKALTEEYIKNPTYPWKYQRLTHFDLATAYKEENQFENALSTYSFLIESSSHATSYFGTAAQLEKTLLEFSLLNADQKKENSPEVQAVCDTLKDLEIKRKLYSEPCHLESALAYIDVMSSFCTKEKKMDRKLLLLNQVNTSFGSLEDPLVAQYLSTKNEFPEKYQLYQQYMDLISIEILNAQSLIAQKQNEQEKYLELNHQMEEKLHQLSSEVTHPRLKNRIQKLNKEMKQII